MLIDLSHTIEDGLVTYKGLPAPVVCDYMTREASQAQYAQGTSFHIGKIEMVANTGTYLDAPFHRYAEGKDVSQLDLQQVAALEAICIHIPENVLTIDERYFTDKPVKGKAVLVNTNWSKHWKTDQYFEGHPHLTESAAQFLKQSGAKLVGIDSLNIDDISGNERPVHSILLGANILIVEHMCQLNRLPESGFHFYAVPVKVKSMGTFPVRAFAKI